jgi:peptide/nickel transport system substrate-binding protein
MRPRHFSSCGLLVAIAIAAGTAAAQDSLRLGMVLEPPHLDPTAGAAAAIREVGYANIFEGLTRIDGNGVVQPALAREWTISDDGLTYVFHLAEGATFHNGVPLEAAHVVFSFERAMAEDSVNAQKQLFEPIASVEATDDATVRVTLQRPTGHFLFNLGWGDMVIVEPSSAEANRSQPVGTGPFRFARWVTGDRVELERNPDYWGEAPALAGATFQFIPDPAAATAAMLAGDIDAFANFPAPGAGPVRGRSALLRRHRLDRGRDHPRHQQCKAALGRHPCAPRPGARRRPPAVIDGAMFGYGTPIGSHFAPHHTAYVDLTDRYPYDPEEAKALLAEAGAEGPGAHLEAAATLYARRSGEIFQAQLAAIGVEVSIIPMEWAQWLEQVFTGKDFDLTIVSHTEPMDIDIYARDDYYFQYDNPAFDAVIDALAATDDQEARAVLFAEAQTILAEDSVNVFLFQLAKHGVWKTGLEGLWHNSPSPPTT